MRSLICPATPADFDPAMADWLAQNHQKPEGMFDANFFGASDDTAYILTRDDHSFRVVLLGRGGLKYDATYSALAAAARLPRRDFSLVNWQTPPQGQPDGDGLVLVLGRDDPAASVVLFSRGGHVASASPADYHALDLK